MASVVATDLSVSFETGTEDRSGRIILQQMTDRFDGRGALWGRTFCNEPVRYTASVGVVEVGNRYPQRINSESISFSDSNSATLKFPGPYDVTILQQVLMRRITRGGITTIEPVSVTLVYDSETESVVTSDDLPVYGKAAVSYTALYEQFFYRPFVQDYGWNGGGVVFNLGTVFAYTNSVVETLEMELDMTSTPSWVEYARVVSKIVLDPKGVWEFPPNWKSTFSSNRSKIGDERQDYPPDGKFPNITDTVDGTNCFVDERVHMIVEVNGIGSLQYKDFNNGGDGYWAWENPYFGNSNYDPAYEIQFAEPPGGSRASNAEEFRYDLNHRTWRDAFLDVDKSALIAKLQREYPGATTYSRSR